MGATYVMQRALLTHNIVSLQIKTLQRIIPSNGIDKNPPVKRVVGRYNTVLYTAN